VYIGDERPPDQWTREEEELQTKYQRVGRRLQGSVPPLPEGGSPPPTGEGTPRPLGVRPKAGKKIEDAFENFFGPLFLVFPGTSSLPPRGIPRTLGG